MELRTNYCLELSQKKPKCPVRSFKSKSYIISFRIISTGRRLKRCNFHDFHISFDIAFIAYCYHNDIVGLLAGNLQDAAHNDLKSKSIFVSQIEGEIACQLLDIRNWLRTSLSVAMWIVAIWQHHSLPFSAIH